MVPARRLSLPEHDYLRRPLDDRHRSVPVPPRHGAQRVVGPCDGTVDSLHGGSLGGEIGYMGTPAGGDSAASLLVPTLGAAAARRHRRTIGRAVAEAALRDHAGRARSRTPSLWFDERAGWATSSAFTDQPVPWVQAVHRRRTRSSADRGKTWERLLPLRPTPARTMAVGERTPAGWTRVFPHVVGEPAAQFLAQWQRSPFADDVSRPPGRAGDRQRSISDAGPAPTSSA